MTDDLKDVLDSQAACRQDCCPRPAARPAQRGFGDGHPRRHRAADSLHRSRRQIARPLLQSRLGLSFLGKLRSSLEEELDRITGNLRETPLGVRS